MLTSRIRHSLASFIDRFWLLACLSLAGYLALAFWFPLRPYFNHSPSPDIGSLAPTLREAALYAFLLCSLYGLYALAYRHIKKWGSEISMPAVLLMAALYCVPLLFTFPINATDTYRYFIRGRISAVHRQNPFDVPVSSLPDEPYGPLAGEWAVETSPYGPLWELTAASATSLAADNLWLGLLIFKGLAAFSFLLAGLLIWLSMPHTSPARRNALFLLWAWNPSLLLIFAMDGHNDALMLVWLTVGWWLMSRDHPIPGMIIMLLAPLTKPIGLLPLPFFFVSCWRRFPKMSGRLRFFFSTALASLFLFFITFLPFGSPIALIQRLMSEVSSGGGFSPLAWGILEAREKGLTPSIQLLIRLGTLLFLFLSSWLLWQTWRGRSAARAAADVFAGYIIQAFRFRIWYAVWPFPWLLLDRGQNEENDISSHARLATGITLLFTSQLSVLIYGQIRKGWLGFSLLRSHRAGILFTFIIPILVGLAVAAYSARSHDRQTEK